MTKLTAIALALGLVAAPAFADPVFGTWQTGVDENTGYYAHIEVKQCGATICGPVVQSFEQGGKPIASPNVGKNIPREMVAEGDGKYRGKVWRPSDDKIFVGKMELDGANTLKVKGCVAGGLICKTQVWTRVN